MKESLSQVLDQLCLSLAHDWPHASAPNGLDGAAPPVTAPQPILVPYEAKGYHVDLSVAPAQIPFTATWLDAQGFVLDTITGVDWIAAGQFEVVYDYFHLTTSVRFVVRCRVARDQAEVPSISGIVPGANWHERETHEFFGIRFSGHPNLTPLLLPEDALFHPLRKDFAA